MKNVVRSWVTDRGLGCILRRWNRGKLETWWKESTGISLSIPNPDGVITNSHRLAASTDKMRMKKKGRRKLCQAGVSKILVMWIHDLWGVRVYVKDSLCSSHGLFNSGRMEGVLTKRGWFCFSLAIRCDLMTAMPAAECPPSVHGPNYLFLVELKPYLAESHIFSRRIWAGMAIYCGSWDVSSWE